MSSTARIFGPVGSYTGDNPGTVPTLTAGTISNVAPVVGAVLAVTGSNAPVAVSTFNWEYRVTPGSGLWGNAGGTRNGATYNTAGQPVGEYRRGVSTPNQPTMIYTPGVTLGSSFTIASLFAGGEDGFAIIPSFTTSFESSNNSDPAEVGDGVQFQTCSSGRGTLRNFSQATAANRPQLALDGSTYALDFESTESDLMSISGSLSIIGAGGVTVFARVKFESVGAIRSIIVADNGGGSNRQFQFRLTAANRLEFFGFATGSGSTVTATSTTTFTTGVWYNVCGIFNTTNCRVWVDEMGDADVEATTANTFGTTSPGTDGPRLGSGSNTMDGLIALALCINRSLTQTERQNLATFASAL